MASVPTASQVRDSHDGQNSSAPASVNKVYQVLPKSSFPSTPFNGTSYQVEFELPNYLGKVIDNVIQFELTLSAGAVLLPTTLWVDRIESVYNSQVVESQDGDQSHVATLGFLTNQEFETIAGAVNIGSDGGAASAVVATKASYYLPLWSNFINSVQPFVRGFGDSWRFRVWLTPNIAIGSTPTITCTKMCLWTTEAQLSEEAVSALERAHKHGINYRGVLQSKWTQPEAAISSSGGEYRKPMTTFTSASAGLLLFVRPNSVAPADQLTKVALRQVALLDSTGSELTQRLPADLVRYFIAPDSVPMCSKFTNTATNSVYLFPLCGNLQNVLETGAVNGGLRFSGSEQIVLLPVADQTNVIVSVVSYDYAVMKVQGGRATIARKA